MGGELGGCRPRACSFQDIDRHRFFNTNSLWIDLRALAKTLERSGGVL
jgi:UTP--glucose-1-phosphate uridylyltransferase